MLKTYIWLCQYKRLEYSSYHSDTIGSLRFNSKYEASSFNADIANTDDIKSFKYKAKLLWNTVGRSNPNQANGILENTTIPMPLKYLNNFWRSLEMPLINCKLNWNLDGRSIANCLHLRLLCY